MDSLVSSGGRPVQHWSLTMAASPLRPTGWVGGRVMPPLPFGLQGAYKSLVVQSNSCRAWSAGLLMKALVFSNAWTALTDVPPKKPRWPLHTGWKLGLCRTLPMPVSIRNYGCCPVVIDCCLRPCHTKSNHSPAWSEQWPGKASEVCLCPLPTSSERPLGWGLEPPCTVPLAH